MKGRSGLLAGALAVCALSVALPASAENPETPTARADRLFSEGRAALEAKRYDEACAKLAESQSLDPATGTLLALALCHEANHKLASAWRELNDVMAASQIGGRSDRAAMAKQHIRSLGPKLSSLAVTVTNASPSRGTEVRVDNEPLPPVHWGENVPVDGGEHVVEAREPGKKPFRAVITVRPEGDRQVVSVPPLEAEAAAPIETPAPVTEAPKRPKSTRTTGWIVGGAGVGALAVGSIFGALALGNSKDAKDACRSISPCADQEATSKSSTALTQAWIADIGIGLGLAGVGVGAYLLLRPEAAPQNVSIAPVRGGAAVSCTGTF